MPLPLQIRLIGTKYFLNINRRFSSSICRDLSENVEDKFKSSLNFYVEKRLTDFGISKKNAEIVASHPALVSFNASSQFNSTLDILGECQFGSHLLEKLITAHPLVLLVDAKVIQRQYSKLISMFTKNYVYDILLRSPEVLNEEWAVTSDKLKYLQDEMVVSNLDITQNGILQHSLLHIKMRHEFLKRTGKYKKLNPKLSSADKHKLNPTIDKVMNTSPEYFSSKVAGVSLIEYDVFQELFLESEE